MLPKQLNNVITLARMAMAAVANDKGVTEENLAEIAADLVAVKKFAATYAVPVDPNLPPLGNA